MQASSCILYSGGHATSQATMNMWLNSKNKDPVSHGADAQSAGTRTHHTACESSPWWTRAVSPRYKHSTPKTGIDLTTCSEGAWTTLPTSGFMRKELKNGWCFLWSMLANHSDCPDNPTIQHLPSCASIKVPVSTCSSDIILSLYFLWNSFDEKWVIYSCQHRPKTLPGKSFFLNQSSGGRAPPRGSSSHYFHTFQERMLHSKINSLEGKCKK